MLPPTAAWLVAALDRFELELDEVEDGVEVALAVDVLAVPVVVPVWLWADAAVWVTPAMIPAVATPPATTMPIPAARARRTTAGVLVMDPASGRALS